MNKIHHWLCSSSIWKRALQHRIVPWVLDGVELGDNVLEAGPGPGLTTSILCKRTARLTAIEIDPRLAATLASQFNNTNVDVIQGDACALPFQDKSFSSVVALTMLHHIPSPVLQQVMLKEVFRVLRHGGMFVGTDNTGGLAFRLLHLHDTMVLVNPEVFKLQLEQAGFCNVVINLTFGRFRFRAMRMA